MSKLDTKGLNMEEYNIQIADAIVRYVDVYNWGWGVIRRQIKLYHGRDLPTAELKQIYKQAKKTEIKDRLRVRDGSGQN